MQKRNTFCRFPHTFGEGLDFRLFYSYLCIAKRKKHTIMRLDLQLISAFILSIGGLVLLFCGIFIDPQGQIHESLLVAFGETATFAGALFGIDYVYKKKK